MKLDKAKQIVAIDAMRARIIDARYQHKIRARDSYAVHAAYSMLLERREQLIYGGNS